MRKEARKYYFSVEGETEQWYLQWLQNTINSDPQNRYIAILDSSIKDPLKYAKDFKGLGRTEITHLFDYESAETVHTQHFRTTLDRMKEAQGI